MLRESSPRLSFVRWASALFCVLSAGIGSGRSSWAQQLAASNAMTQVSPMNPASAAAHTGPAPAPAAASTAPGVDLKRLEEYKRSPLFVEPFDPNVLSLPDEHLIFIRNVTRNDLAFYKTILNEGIEMRNKMAPSVRLLLKYSTRLMGLFIKNRREEKRLKEKVEPKAEFYNMLANLTQAVVDTSGQLKPNYSKDTINIENFRSRVETLFDTIRQTIDISPMGAYLKWDQFVLYKDQPRNGVQNRNFTDEAGDLTAQWRVMGYEKTIFFVRRIVNLLRLFARGVVPSSENEV